MKGAEDDIPLTEFEPTEGGWGWFVAFAFAISKLAFWGTLPCFGIMFSDVLESNPDYKGTAVTTSTGIFMVCACIPAALCPALYKLGLSIRNVGAGGGLICFIGSFSTIFVVSMPQVFFTYGVIQGLGFGLMLSAVLAAFNLHFRRRRTVAMAIAQVLSGVETLALPPMAQGLSDWRGPPAARAGFAAVSLLAALCQWLLRPPPTTTKRGAAPGLLSRGETRKKENYETEKCRSKTLLPKLEREPVKNAWSQRMKALWRATGLHASLLRDPHLVAVACCVALVNLADANFFALLPLHLRALAASDAEVTHLVTAACAGDLAGRAGLVVVGGLLAKRNRITFASAAFVTAAAIVALAYVERTDIILGLVIVLGLCKGILYVTYYLNFAEIVPPEKFPSAVAFYFAAQALFSLGVSPLLGLTRDLTGSFPACFLTLASILLLCPVVWGIQMALRACSTQHSGGRRRRTQV